jgi:hypothetical protein
MCGCTIPYSCVQCKKGDRGLVGPPGPQGPRGLVGYTGEQGSTGQVGPTGSAGHTGPGGGGGGGIGLTGTSYGQYLYWNHNTTMWAVGGNTITIGSNAGANGVGANSVALGPSALYNSATTPTGAENVCVGNSTGTSLTTGYSNVLIGGTGTGKKISSGYGNVVVGAGSGQGITSGYSNIIIGQGSSNSINTGFMNVIVGLGGGIGGGYYNTCVGQLATTGGNTTYSTALGSYASNAGNSYSTAVGYQAANNSWYQVMLGAPFSSVVSAGTFDAQSGIFTSTTTLPTSQNSLGFISPQNTAIWTTSISSTIQTVTSFTIDPFNNPYGTYLVTIYMCVTNGGTSGAYYTSLSTTTSPQQPTDVTYMPAGTTNTIKYTVTIQCYGTPTTYNLLCYSDSGVTGTINISSGPTDSYMTLTRIA